MGPTLPGLLRRPLAGHQAGALAGSGAGQPVTERPEDGARDPPLGATLTPEAQPVQEPDYQAA